MEEDMHKKSKHAVYITLQAVVEFLRLARNVENKNDFTFSGQILRLMALEEAKRIDIENFQASGGWLTRVKERHGIMGTMMSGDAAAVDLVVVENWKERLVEMILDNGEANIFNCDETCLFWLQSSSRTLVLPGNPAHGGKVDGRDHLR